MTRTASHPAILAGLLGSATWASAPTVALATPLEDFAQAVSDSLLLRFAVGCAVGAAVAAVVLVVSERFATDEDESLDEFEEFDELDEFDEHEELEATGRLTMRRSAMAQAALEADEADDPTSDLGRVRTGQIVIELPSLAQEAVAQAIQGPRHLAADGQRRPARIATRRTGRHFVGATPTRAEEPALRSVTAENRSTTVRGKHFADYVELMVATAVEQASQDLRSASRDTDKGIVPSRRERLLALPTIEAETSVEHNEAPYRKVKAAFDTMDLARPAGRQAVSSQSRTARGTAAPAAAKAASRQQRAAALRRKGVREVLSERLSSAALEGVPIIERADGSTNMPTPTWFDQTFAPAIAGITGGLAAITGNLDDTLPQVTDAGSATRVETERTARSEYIAGRVAEVNEGIFPERRSADELEHEDAWAQSMAALGETIAQVSPAQPVFRDMVGGPSTIDDPDGLEPPTGFIPFRVPAGHAEVVDTATYVDYLLRDELSNNRSETLRASSHAHLRVIEGGTGRERTRKRGADAAAPATRGRHFAPERMVAEA